MSIPKQPPNQTEQEMEVHVYEGGKEVDDNDLPDALSEFISGIKAGEDYDKEGNKK